MNSKDLRKRKEEILSTIKAAVKSNCYECMGGHKKIDCEIEGCYLYPFRPFKKD